MIVCFVLYFLMAITREQIRKIKALADDHRAHPQIRAVAQRKLEELKILYPHLFAEQSRQEYRSQPRPSPQEKSEHERRRAAQRPFSLKAKLELTTKYCPWHPRSEGALFHKILVERTPCTVEEIVLYARGITATRVQGHLRWLYTWGDYLKVDGKLWRETQ